MELKKNPLLEELEEEGSGGAIANGMFGESGEGFHPPLSLFTIPTVKLSIYPGRYSRVGAGIRS